jgi:hypothetical protein
MRMGTITPTIMAMTTRMITPMSTGITPIRL